MNKIDSIRGRTAVHDRPCPWIDVCCNAELQFHVGLPHFFVLKPMGGVHSTAIRRVPSDETVIPDAVYLETEEFVDVSPLGERGFEEYSKPVPILRLTRPKEMTASQIG